MNIIFMHTVFIRYFHLFHTVFWALCIRYYRIWALAALLFSVDVSIYSPLFYLQSMFLSIYPVSIYIPCFYLQLTSLFISHVSVYSPCFYLQPTFYFSVHASRWCFYLLRSEGLLLSVLTRCQFVRVLTLDKLFFSQHFSSNHFQVLRDCV